jgi:rhodanese-related sulfurtransferase
MSARVHELRRLLAAVAIVLAVLAAAVGAPEAPVRVAASFIADGERADVFPARTVDAIQLAAWIREGARDLRVLDLRGDSAYRAQHVPSAEAADFARLDTLARRPDATVVLYSNDDVRDAQAWANLAARGHAHAYVLDGGMDAWLDEVMKPVLRGDSADYVAALSRYFGGAPRARPPQADAVKPRVIPAAVSDEFGETGRRGC